MSNSKFCQITNEDSLKILAEASFYRATESKEHWRILEDSRGSIHGPRGIRGRGEDGRWRETKARLARNERGNNAQVG